MMTLVVLGATAATGVLALVLFVVLTRVLRGREGFWPDTLGTVTRLFLCGAVSALFSAAVTSAYVHAGESHQIRDVEMVRTSTDSGSSSDSDSRTCRFVWPTDTADRQQTASCPPFAEFYVDKADAVRVPGTRFVMLLDHGLDFFTLFLLLIVAGPCATVALIGGWINSRPDKRWRRKQHRRLTASWRSGGPRPAPRARPAATTTSGARDDLTWPEIAAASERPDVQGGPLEQAPYVPASGTTAVPSVPLGYPLPYVRIMTRPARAPHRSVLLLMTSDGAWWLEVDGQPTREGTAVVERNPSRPNDLSVTIGEYVFDAGDAPAHLTQAALDSLRSLVSTWATTPTDSPRTTTPQQSPPTGTVQRSESSAPRSSPTSTDHSEDLS